MTFRITIRDERQVPVRNLFRGQFETTEGVTYDEAMKDLLRICSLVHADRKYGMGVDRIDAAAGEQIKP